ncbi:hypothetical protein WMY93_032975 [Mugilogobius chulae]|uniref:Uncharacterized protein n=1 Tax=Mugilogobius chulae TaxID=88201 RepID=A0AAW0MJU8_9GOBI
MNEIRESCEKDERGLRAHERESTKPARTSCSRNEETSEGVNQGEREQRESSASSCGRASTFHSTLDQATTRPLSTKPPTPPNPLPEPSYKHTPHSLLQA